MTEVARDGPCGLPPLADCHTLRWAKAAWRCTQWWNTSPRPSPHTLRWATVANADRETI